MPTVHILPDPPSKWAVFKTVRLDFALGDTSGYSPEAIGGCSLWHSLWQLEV